MAGMCQPVCVRTIPLLQPLNVFSRSRLLEKALVTFLPDDVTYEARLGDALLDAALNAGVFVPAACGGAGACGRCKVKVVQGSLDTTDLEKMSQQERAEGYVLACRSHLTGEITVEVPRARTVRKIIPRDEAERMRVTAAAMESPVTPEINPMSLRLFLEPSPPTAEDNVNDLERIVRTLKVNHGITRLKADLEVVRGLPVDARAEAWRLTASLWPDEISDSGECAYKLFRCSAGHQSVAPTAVAVDIGTTSLWGELIDLETGTVLARASRYNPQISMGDDVISRIIFALKKDGLDKLQQQVVAGINEIIDEILSKSKLGRESIQYLVAAGNTVMTHLFLALYPKFLRESPVTCPRPST